MQQRSSLLTQAINSGATSPSHSPAPASCSAERPNSPPAASGLRTSTMCMSTSSSRHGGYTLGRRCSPGSAGPAQRPTAAHFTRGSWDQSLPQNNSVLQAQYLDDLQASSTPPDRPPSVIGAEASLHTHDSVGTRGHTLRSSWDEQPHHMQPQLLTGHSDAVLSLCLNSNGRMYSSSSDKTIRVRAPPLPPTT